MTEQMKDGIRKILLKRETKRQGKKTYAYKVPYRDANGKQTSETFPTLKQARIFREKVRSMRHAGISIDPKAGRVSVRDYGQEWLAAAFAHKRPRTARQYSANLRNHVFPLIGGKRINAVTRADIQTVINTAAASLAPRTVRQLYRTLVVMFGAASNHDKIITESPCRAITLPEIPHRDVKVLTPDEIAHLAAVIDPRYRALVWVAAGTGLRMGELLGLTWDRIDLDARTLTVDRQLDTETDQLAPVKTRSSRRVVPLPDTIVDALTTHQTSYPSRPQAITRTKQLGGGTETVALVFTDRHGHVVTRARLTHAFRKARAAAGLTAEVTLHALRHTYASLLIAGGAHPKVVQTRLGHASITITMDTYGHLYPEEQDRTRGVIDNAFDPATSHNANPDDPPAALPIPA